MREEPSTKPSYNYSVALVHHYSRSNRTLQGNLYDCCRSLLDVPPSQAFGPSIRSYSLAALGQSGRRTTTTVQ